MTSTVCILPILAALFTANNFEEIQDVHWKTTNIQQEILTQNYWPNRTDLDLLKEEEMRSKASRDVNIVNQFLTENNFGIQLPDLNNSFAFYVASILKVTLEWEEKGSKSQLYLDEGESVYPAVSFSNSERSKFNVFDVINNQTPSEKSNPILQIKAKNGDLVYMMVAPDKNAPLTGFSLLSQITDVWQKNIVDKNRVYYDEAIFPMVDINQEVDISWLEGLIARSQGTRGYEDKYVIVRALQQTKFKMDELGAIVESAVAFCGIELACYEKVLEINDSFYLWIMRPGMKTPVFAAYIDKDSWKAPVR